MKRLALALAMVMACSSAAMALGFDVWDLTLSGINTWTDGKYVPAGEDMKSALDNNTLKVKGSGEGWESKAEIKINTSGNQYGTPALTLDDVLIRIKEKPFTLEVWNWGEDGEGVDKKTPLEFVFANDAPGSNWAARLSTTIGGASTAFMVKSDQTAPDYYFWAEKPFGSNTFGAAYRTFFNHTNIADGWVKADLGGAKVTVEVAKHQSADWSEDSAWAYGAIAEFPSKLTLKGYVAERAVMGAKNLSEFNNAKDKKYVEALYNNQFRASYTIEDANKLNTLDIRFRQYPEGAAIGDMWQADNGYFDMNVPGDNDWMRQKGYAVGLQYYADESAADADTLKLHASYSPASNISVYGRYFTFKVSGENKNLVALRGFWGLTDKLALYPRLWINSTRPIKDDNKDELRDTKYSATDSTVTWKEGNTVFGTFVNYKMVKGQLQAGLWFESYSKGATDDEKSNTTIQLGYEIGL